MVVEGKLLLLDFFSCDSSSICDNACNVVVDVVVVVRLFCQKCVNEFFSSK